FQGYFTTLLVRAGLRADADVGHGQRPSERVVAGVRRLDRGGELPLAKNAGIAEHFERLGAGLGGKTTEAHQHDNCRAHVAPTHRPTSHRCARYARASATSVRAASASPAMATIVWQ